jgi:hypothetical protein
VTGSDRLHSLVGQRRGQHPHAPTSQIAIAASIYHQEIIKHCTARNDSPLQEETNGGKSDYSAIQKEEFVDEADDDDKRWTDNDTSLTSTCPHSQQMSPPKHTMHLDASHVRFHWHAVGVVSLFHNPSAGRWVMILFYTKLFLILGNDIFVMSHAVAAMI